MPKFDLVASTPVVRSPRVIQLEGMFEIAPTQTSDFRLEGELPLEDRAWSIGMIVGPSGCGKSTMARNLFGDSLVGAYSWSESRSIVDDFPASLGIKDITGLLSRVGFCSPPSWLRPFAALSNGEQFRVTLARAMAESAGLFVIDEFTSVVDRNVAQIGSAALASAIRSSGRQMVAVGVHYDVIPWLQPDWVYEPHLERFQWRELCRRPAIELEIVPCHRSAWNQFKRYHYLDTSLNTASQCFVALYQGKPVAFTAALHTPHPRAPRWREHRTVCLPDYQGVGIGNAISEFVASLFVATGKPYGSVSANPAMIHHRAKSPLWRMVNPPKLSNQTAKVGGRITRVMTRSSASQRLTASFVYVGPARQEEAVRLGVIRTLSRKEPAHA